MDYSEAASSLHAREQERHLLMTLVAITLLRPASDTDIPPLSDNGTGVRKHQGSGARGTIRPKRANDRPP